MCIAKCLLILATINMVGAMWSLAMVRKDLDWDHRLELIGVWPILLLSRLLR